jgi:hypothetical protein
MARALYKDPLSVSQCTAKIAQLVQQLNTAAAAEDSKAPAFVDTAVPDRATRHYQLPNDAGAAQIEEEWGHVNRLYSECYNEHKKGKVFPLIGDIVSHLIQIDPFGRPLYYLIKAQTLKDRADRCRRNEAPEVKEGLINKRKETLQRVLTVFQPSAFTSPVFEETHAGVQIALALCSEKEEAIRIYTSIIASVDNTDMNGPTPFRIVNELLRERALQLRAVCLSRTDLKDRNRLLLLNPTNPEYWRDRARVHKFRGDFKNESEDNTRAEALEQAAFIGESKGPDFKQFHSETVSAVAGGPVATAAAAAPPGAVAPTVATAAEAASYEAKQEALRTTQMAFRARDSRDRSPKGGSRDRQRKDSRSRSPRRSKDPLPATPSPPSQPRTPPMPATPATPAMRQTPRADWSIEQTGDWLSHFGAAFATYRQAAKDNCLEGPILAVIAQEKTDAEAFKYLSDAGITNKVHARVILSQLRLHLKDGRQV